MSCPPVQLYPQPASKPWQAVLLAGRATARTIDRIVEYGDGWIPAFASEDGLRQGPAQIEEGRRLLDKSARAAGRDPSTLPITAILRGPQIDGDLSAGQVVDPSNASPVHW